jgi:ATP-dependent exoDNAse (exonuclease V) beta subunit
VQFFEDNENNWETNVLNELPQIVEDLVRQGHHQRDIAILIRKGAEGKKVVEKLTGSFLANGNPLNINLVSSDSIYLYQASVIRLLIAVMKYMVYPDDKLNQAFIVNEISRYNNDVSENLEVSAYSNASFEASSVLPNDITESRHWFLGLPLTESIEQLICRLHLNKRVENVSYLQAFQDVIREYGSKSGSGMAGFLDYWSENGLKCTVAASDEQDAVRVLTVHKSKGLEFKTVIIPFCDWLLDNDAKQFNILWCPTADTPFSEMEYLPLKYSQALATTAFATTYFDEKVQAFNDNLNLLYVAFTRAAQNLFVFAGKPGKNIKTVGGALYEVIRSTENITGSEFPSLNLTSHWNEVESIFEIGSLTGKLNEKSTFELDNSEIPSYPVFIRPHPIRQRVLTVLPGSSEGLAGERPVNYGVFMHKLFQQIETLKDVPIVLNQFVREGIINASEKFSLMAFVQEKLSSPPFNDWFSGQYELFTERDILHNESGISRPDRVIVQGNKAIVIDYKFGLKKEKSYSIQVQRYAGLMKEMGYSEVEGFVWYVKMDELDKL